MTNFVIYSHENFNPEADLIRLCACTSRRAAEYIVKALEYRDKCGNPDSKGVYDYYIKEEE